MVRRSVPLSSRWTARQHTAVQGAQYDWLRSKRPLDTCPGCTSSDPAREYGAMSKPCASRYARRLGMPSRISRTSSAGCLSGLYVARKYAGNVFSKVFAVRHSTSVVGDEEIVCLLSRAPSGRVPMLWVERYMRALVQRDIGEFVRFHAVAQRVPEHSPTAPPPVCRVLFRCVEADPFYVRPEDSRHTAKRLSDASCPSPGRLVIAEFARDKDGGRPSVGQSDFERVRVVPALASGPTLSGIDHTLEERWTGVVDDSAASLTDTPHRATIHIRVHNWRVGLEPEVQNHVFVGFVDGYFLTLQGVFFPGIDGHGVCPCFQQRKLIAAVGLRKFIDE